MKKIKIFCTSLKYYKILEKLPKYIIPLGVGKEKFPKSWIDEKNGINISHLNSYYGELTGIYWIWKNAIDDMNNEDIIGNCHYRKLWLNQLYLKKQKNTFNSLYSKLLNFDNLNFNKLDAIQVQPIFFKTKNLMDDFFEIHGTDILDKSLHFLDSKNRKDFSHHLKNNKLFPLNMFITKVKYFREYCEIIFPWLHNCFKYCEANNLLKGYNSRLPAFLAERFTSYWYSQKKNKISLSYARLGKFFLSNQVNKYLNPTKIPLTFRMYPTIHKY